MFFYFKYSVNNYPVDKRYPIGKTFVTNEKEPIIERKEATYKTSIDNANKEYDKITMVDDQGNILVLYAKDGGSFKLKNDMELVDQDGNVYQCEVEKTDRDIYLRAIIPFVIPYTKRIKKMKTKKIKCLAV